MWIFKTHHEKIDHIEYSKGELHGEAIPRVEAMEKERAELETNKPSLELASLNSQHEIDGLYLIHEMDAAH